jgi:glycosyltransferase involved in cell wall biosynthesis
MNGISIIICCYNSSSRLEKTIQHIALQKQVDFSFEVVLVDNKSTDKTSIIAQELFFKYEIKNYNIVSEPTLGLIYARKCGVLNANHDVLIFCDDDNWLDENYLFNIALGFKTYPNAGILGSWSEPVFNENQIIPEWFDHVKECFAIIDKPSFDRERYFVVGAGMAIQKKIADLILNEEFQFTGRKGNLLLSGEDNEICEKIIKLGYKVYQLRNLKFTHYLPPNRLTWDYVIRLYIGFGHGDMQRSLLTYHKSFIRLYAGYSLLNFIKILKSPLPFLFFLFNKKGAISALPFYRIHGCYKYLHSKK